MEHTTKIAYIPSNYRFSFGKFRGKLASNVPTWYLNWALKTFPNEIFHNKGKLFKIIEEVI